MISDLMYGLIVTLHLSLAGIPANFSGSAQCNVVRQLVPGPDRVVVVPVKSWAVDEFCGGHAPFKRILGCYRIIGEACYAFVVTDDQTPMDVRCTVGHELLHCSHGNWHL